jgi:3-oxoacyl-[acyl-carrier-protein] synthase II
MSDRRIVVTGMGMLSPIGNSVEESWQAACAGKSGITLVNSLFDTDGLSTTIAGCVKNYEPSDYFDSKDARRLDLFIQYGVAAAVQAVRDAGLEISDANAHRAGVCVGSGIGGLTSIDSASICLEQSGPRKVSPFFITSAIINMVAGHISMRFNCKGPNISIVTACTTGTHNIGQAYRMLKYGDADVVLCGGSEQAVSRLGIAGFAATRALSTNNADPTGASRPWDEARDGFVMGDGAGVMVLETLEHAKARGAKIYAEVVGFGMSSDAYHITQPDPSGHGFRLVMQNALKDARIGADAIDYINAHGTSTPLLDPLEAEAIKNIFSGNKNLAVSSTKSMTGHLLGAAGAVEAIFSVKAIEQQIAPPTINLDNPIAVCAGMNMVPHAAQEMQIDYALSNSFGFGGTNATIIFKRFSD